MFDTLRGLDPNVFFVPGTKGYRLFAKPYRPGQDEESFRKTKKKWSVHIPVRVRAMVLAGDKLFVAGPPDVVPDDDPAAAFEGRRGAELWAISAKTGEKIAERAHDFAAQFVNMYTGALGEWSRPVVVVAVFITMLSTTLTVLDGYPRVLTSGCGLAWPGTARFRRAAHRINDMDTSIKSIVFRKKLGYIKGINPEIEKVIEEIIMKGSCALSTSLKEKL